MGCEPAGIFRNPLFGRALDRPRWGLRSPGRRSDGLAAERFLIPKMELEKGQEAALGFSTLPRRHVFRALNRNAMGRVLLAIQPEYRATAVQIGEYQFPRCRPLLHSALQ